MLEISALECFFSEHLLGFKVAVNFTTIDWGWLKIWVMARDKIPTVYSFYSFTPCSEVDEMIFKASPGRGLDCWKKELAETIVIVEIPFSRCLRD